METNVQEVSVADLDALLDKVLAARAEYEAKKEESNKAHEVKKQLEGEMLALLKKAGKTKYFVDGVGTASLVQTLSIQVPKTTNDKRKLWEYIVLKYGEEVAFDKFSMHSKTLNSFYNQEFESISDEEKMMFKLPGTEEPTAQEEFRFRKA